MEKGSGGGVKGRSGEDNDKEERKKGSWKEEELEVHHKYICVCLL